MVVCVVCLLSFFGSQMNGCGDGDGGQRMEGDTMMDIYHFSGPVWYIPSMLGPARFLSGAVLVAGSVCLLELGHSTCLPACRLFFFLFYRPAIRYVTLKKAAPTLCACACCYVIQSMPHRPDPEIDGLLSCACGCQPSSPLSTTLCHDVTRSVAWGLSIPSQPAQQQLR